jgi:hypothetical protein
VWKLFITSLADKNIHAGQHCFGHQGKISCEQNVDDSIVYEQRGGLSSGSPE